MHKRILQQNALHPAAVSALHPSISYDKLAEFYARNEDVPFIPDNLTLAQVILDAQHPMSPPVFRDKPWLVNYQDGREFGFKYLMPSTSTSIWLKMKLSVYACQITWVIRSKFGLCIGWVLPLRHISQILQT